MVEVMVVQKVQHLSKFLSDNDGWPLKSKLLSYSINLELNDTNLLQTSAYFPFIFLSNIKKNDLMTSSRRHSDVTNSDFCQTFSNMIYLIEIFLLCKFEVIWIIQTEAFYTRLNCQDIVKFKQIAPTDIPPWKRVESFPIEIFICTRYVMNSRIFWRVFLLLQKFLITFFCRFRDIFCNRFLTPKYQVLEL